MNWFVGEENEDDIITVIIVKTLMIWYMKPGTPPNNRKNLEVNVKGLCFYQVLLK